jgi:uncharacterized protein DUF4276
LVKEIRIYIEGGGDLKNQKTMLRQGFSIFFKPLIDNARNRKIRWNITMCGKRDAARRDFHNACNSHPDAFNLLLVDSEGPVDSAPKHHLNKRDGWSLELSEEHYHLMVQTMESWLIADIDALKQFYGKDFQESSIPPNNNVEQIPKNQLTKSLEKASQKTQKGKYHKIRHATKILQLLNEKTVQSKAPHYQRFFETVSSQINSN